MQCVYPREEDWELFYLEHGILARRTILWEPEIDNIPHTTSSSVELVPANKCIEPRVVFVDLEPTVVDEVRTAIIGRKNAANNYADARWQFGWGTSAEFTWWNDCLPHATRCNCRAIQFHFVHTQYAVNIPIVHLWLTMELFTIYADVISAIRLYSPTLTFLDTFVYGKI